MLITIREAQKADSEKIVSGIVAILNAKERKAMLPSGSNDPKYFSATTQSC